MSRVLLLLLVGGALYALVSLGFWQLDRGAEKARIQQAYSTRAGEPPLRVSANLLDPQAFEHYRAEASGTWQTQSTILIDNQILDGRPGYHVMTPLQLRGTGTLLLVNRGWIPWSVDRAVIPTVDSSTGPVHLSGLLKYPSDDYYTLETRLPSLDRPVWQNLDMAALAAQLGAPLQPMVMLLDPAAPEGFVRQWPSYQDDTWVARHRGYAMQWFGLAMILVLLTAAVGWKSRRGADRSEEVEDD